MQVPTEAEEYTKLMEYLIRCQESAAMLAHLSNNYGVSGRTRAIGWLACEQQFKQIQRVITTLAQGKLN